MNVAELIDICEKRIKVTKEQMLFAEDRCSPSSHAYHRGRKETLEWIVASLGRLQGTVPEAPVEVPEIPVGSITLEEAIAMVEDDIRAVRERMAKDQGPQRLTELYPARIESLEGFLKLLRSLVIKPEGCEHSYTLLDTKRFTDTSGAYNIRYTRIDSFFCAKCLDRKTVKQEEWSRSAPDWF